MVMCEGTENLDQTDLIVRIFTRENSWMKGVKPAFPALCRAMATPNQE